MDDLDQRGFKIKINKKNPQTPLRFSDCQHKSPFDRLSCWVRGSLAGHLPLIRWAIVCEARFPSSPATLGKKRHRKRTYTSCANCSTSQPLCLASKAVKHFYLFCFNVDEFDASGNRASSPKTDSARTQRHARPGQLEAVPLDHGRTKDQEGLRKRSPLLGLSPCLHLD